MSSFNGLGLHLGNLSRLSSARTRSLSAENVDGAKGRGGMATEGISAKYASQLGRGWKVSPAVDIKPGETFTVADIRDQGALQQMWITPTGNWRFSILRMYWDDQEHPSVECPLGDFFGQPWGKYAPLVSLPVCVNPGSAFNCYWEMPFRKRCRITVSNLADEPMTLFYQVNYTLTDVPADCAYFHAQFRRTNPVPYRQDYTIVDGIKGRGQYVGTVMGWGANNGGWWGEGEIKFFLDGDAEWPTICGTGTEDYFCGSYCFINPYTRAYETYTTPYAGFHQIVKAEGSFTTPARFGLYRWHVTDPVRFESDLRITMQALGWRTSKDQKYLPLQDDVCSVAFWYQTLPSAPFPALPDRDYLEII